MKIFKGIIVPIIITGIWINISETLRWMFLVQPYWIRHYESLGLTLPNDPGTMIAWMVWGFLFGSIIFILSRKFNVWQTTVLSWFAVFVMLWIAVWAVGILPTGMLWFNIPLSFLETFIAVYISTRLFKQRA